MSRAVPALPADLARWHQRVRAAAAAKRIPPGHLVVCEDGTTRLSLPAQVHADRRWFR